MAEELKTLAGKTVTFVYENEHRTVEVEQVKHCGNGAAILIGKDYDRDMKYRSFNLNKMTALTVK